MRIVLNEGLNVEEGSQYNVPLQHNISQAEQNDSEQYNNPVVSSNTNITLNKDTSIVENIVIATKLVE